ncbi:FUSC family protein [Pseudonocardia nantongensis]|uniref:FUSC family protein n=1 Tax=Pseudonocardia nantongensis TaxID=1181885 RepID=UPI00397CC96C
MPQVLTRELVRFAPHDGAHRPALRCAISVAVPMLTLLAIGRIDLVGATAFGAFTAIFARDLTVPARTAVQAVCGLGLTASVAIGVAAAHLPATPWLQLLVVVAVAAVATVGGEMIAWKPRGPLFFVFAAGAFAGSAPMPAGWGVQAVVTTAATALFATLVGSAGRLLPSHAPSRRPLVVTGFRKALSQRPVTDIIVACALTVPLTVALGIEHHYWALVAAVVPLTVVGTTGQAARAVMRIGGTVGGLGVAAALLVPELPMWGVVLVVIVLQGVAELLVLRNYTVALLFITPLALLVSHVMHPGPEVALLLDRLVSTSIGVVVALLVLAARIAADRIAADRFRRSADRAH